MEDLVAPTVKPPVGTLVGPPAAFRAPGETAPVKVKPVPSAQRSRPDTLEKAHAAAGTAVVTGNVAAPTPYGFWEGVDGRHGNASPRDKMVDPATGRPMSEITVRIARRMDPAQHGTSLVKDRPNLYQDLLARPDNSVTPEQFYRILEKRVPKSVMEELNNSIKQISKLHEMGLGPPPPLDKTLWQRALIQTYLHSVDIVTVMKSLGFDPEDPLIYRQFAGANEAGGETCPGCPHDLVEFVPLKDIRWQMEQKVYPDWFDRLMDKLEEVGQEMLVAPDGTEEEIKARIKAKLPELDADFVFKNFLKVDSGVLQVNISALGPFGSAMVLWGDAREDANGLMDPHRLSPHHNGNSTKDVQWVEKATNFLTHHMPREHIGIRHLPRGEWDNLEHALGTDTAISHSEIGKAIARDAATVWQQLEVEGKVVPWQKLKLPEGVDSARIQRGYESLQSQNALGDKRFAKFSAEASLAAKKAPAMKSAVASFQAALEDVSQVKSGKLLHVWRSLAQNTQHEADQAVVNALGELLAARSAQVSVTDKDTATRMSTVITELDAALRHPAPVFVSLEELLRSIEMMEHLPAAIESARKQDDRSMAGTYQEWLDIWKEGFPYPRAVGGGVRSGALSDAK
jgi:hypothetical protein